jgi:hypothetical protein
MNGKIQRLILCKPWRKSVQIEVPSKSAIEGTPRELRSAFTLKNYIDSKYYLSVKKKCYAYSITTNIFSSNYISKG